MTDVHNEPAKESDVLIHCDNREAKSRVYAILKDRCVLQEKNLDVGDYILSDRVGVERKDCKDFVQSIIDKRLFRQAGALRESFECPILIIEGEDLFDTRINIHQNAIRGAVASVAIEFSIPIIWTKSQLETAEMLLAIAKREQLHLRKGVSIRVRKKSRSMNELQEFLLSGLPKVNTVTAKKLLKHFGTPKSIFNASEAELQQVEGIGKELSAKILKILNSKYEKSILED